MQKVSSSLLASSKWNRREAIIQAFQRMDQTTIRFAGNYRKPRRTQSSLENRRIIKVYWTTERAIPSNRPRQRGYRISRIPCKIRGEYYSFLRLSYEFALNSIQLLRGRLFSVDCARMNSNNLDD